MKREVDVHDFSSVSNEWLVAVTSHPANSEGIHLKCASLRPIEVNSIHTTASGTCRKLILSGTSITDNGIAHLHKLKSLTCLDVSRYRNNCLRGLHLFTNTSNFLCSSDATR
jgi:hypothetical protein